ncbi:amino acid adenylation domain-containing protein [Streptomyces sp. AC550_RSS872]|uniref:amino acid adenylation domain-containing protein n=1 Tax=Streptomyces sp. AC550_RSS872 TaxID=2823689 RepID=UPI0020B7B9EA|nr:amino acid adenylation domain-containing protein [Streptomyces sp. AC550_RSS872]
MTSHAQEAAPAQLAMSPDVTATAAGRALVRPGPVPRPAPLVSDAVHAHARDRPDQMAFIEGGTRTTYRQLHEAVARLRTLLLERACAPGDRVAVSGPRGLNSAVAFLALESLGATYVPVDPTWPTDRLVRIFSQTQCAYVLVHDGRVGTGSWAPEPTLARAVAETDVELLEMARAAALEPSPAPRGRPHDADRQARYIIYTSGSTGTPKGAVVEHQGMANHLRHMVETLGIVSDDVVAFTAPPTYVVSVWQMLAALSAGAAVAVIDDFTTVYPRRLLKALDEHRVTMAQMVPTMIALVVDELRRQDADDPLPRLRWLIATGEELRPHLAAGVLGTLPGARLMNAYGMSECSDDVAQHVVRHADTQRARLPVGRPVANTALHVFVEEESAWRPASPGEVGELFVGGLPVGAGYVDAGAAARTAAFFHDDVDPGSPTRRLYRTGDLAYVEDGVLYYVGRVDRQVKIRGVRVELDEVESVLRRHPSVAECAVTVEAVEESHRLRVHYVPADDVTPKELEKFLGESLPTPLPTHWVRLTKLPLTRNGKTDYRAVAGLEPVTAG